MGEVDIGLKRLRNLPVPGKLLAVVESERVNPVFKLAPALPAASVALPVGLLTAQVPVEIPAPGLVGVDEAVDLLGADTHSGL